MAEGVRRFLTVEEFRERVPVGRTLAYDLLRRRVIRSVSFGRRRLVRVSEVERLEAEGLREEPRASG